MKFKEKRMSLDEEQLYGAVLELKDVEECFNFFRDLCTPAEIKALKERWRIAQILDEGELSYREIALETGASLATIGRVARFLKDESFQGYRKIIDRVKLKKVNKK